MAPTPPPDFQVLFDHVVRGTSATIESLPNTMVVRGVIIMALLGIIDGLAKADAAEFGELGAHWATSLRMYADEIEAAGAIKQ